MTGRTIGLWSIADFWPQTIRGVLRLQWDEVIRVQFPDHVQTMMRRYSCRGAAFPALEVTGVVTIGAVDAEGL